MARTLSPIGLLISMTIAAAGCGGRSAVELHPVTFAVQYNGKPAEGATVILDPVGGGEGTAKPTGVVDATGKVTFQTHPHGAGAPAGEYVVLVTWFPPDARQSANPKNKLPAKYGAAATTPLPRITVRPGDNSPPPVSLTGP